MTNPPDIAPGPGSLVGGRYLLGELLGVGGSAAVYAARDKLLETELAIKVFSRSDSANLARIQQEASLSMSLTHPAIVRCFGTFQEAGWIFLLFELVRGESLRARLERGPLPLPLAISVLAATAEALAYAHAAGVIHRDISPGNILLVPSDQVPIKLLDFGISKQLAQEQRSTHTIGIGTAAYAAPEQLSGKTTPQSDIYGLGAVGFHMLTGSAPTIGRSKAISAELPSATPVWLATLLSDCLQLDATDRPASAEVISERISRASKTNERSTTLRTRKRIRIALIGAVLSLGFLAGSIRFSADWQSRAGTVCAWLERTGLIEWDNPRIIALMGLAAVERGNTDTLKRIFGGNRLSPDTRQEFQLECFLQALERGQVETARALIELGTSVDGANQDRVSRILTGALASHTPAVLPLLISKGFDMRLVFEQFTPFSYASNANDLPMFNALLKLFSAFDELPRVADPPLWAAIISPYPERFLPAVVSAGPHVVNAKDARGSTALVRAVVTDPKLVRLALSAGADINQPADNGTTPLLFALASSADQSAPARARRLEIVKLLLERGANVNVLTTPGLSPLSSVVDLQDVEALELLATRPDLEINAPDMNGEAAITRALRTKGQLKPELIATLLKHGADPEILNRAGRSARDIAKLHGREHLLPPPRESHE